MNRVLTSSLLPTSSIIAETCARYALERLDYHDHFPWMTATDIERVLRYEDPRSERHATVMRKLLVAQQRAPHDLWILLLVCGMEDTLARRRQQFYELENPRLAKLVLKSFIVAVQDIPRHIPAGSLLPYVLRFSEAVLRQSVLRFRGPLVNRSDIRAGKEASR